MAAGEALRVGSQIPAITGFNPNALQQQATLCLYTIAEEQATRSAAIFHQRADDADRSPVYGAGAAGS